MAAVLPDDPKRQGRRVALRDGWRRAKSQEPIANVADSHVGSIKASVVLTTNDQLPTTYKLLEDNHVIIIRNGKRYDVTGKKL